MAKQKKNNNLGFSLPHIYQVEYYEHNIDGAKYVNYCSIPANTALEARKRFKEKTCISDKDIIQIQLEIL